MGAITDLTRMWLTRTRQPFIFRNENDPILRYGDCDSLGLYVHIPFCRSICNFCPYCKVKYEKAICDRYVDALLGEIHMVGKQHPGKKKVTSLYFGGGSPALAVERIPEIIGALQEHFEITDGIGLELHPADVTVETLQKLKNASITRISIGIQSFQSKYQHILGRPPVDPATLRQALDTVPFDTVSMDLIFALPEQTFEALKQDIDLAFSAGANHIAIYPFIDFTFTTSPVKAMEKKEKRALLDEVTGYFQEIGCHRDSIWTFAKDPGAKYSSMTRENFLGFGCSATTLLKDRFKINTFSVVEYCKRISKETLPTCLTVRFTLRQRMVYWLFWTAYSTRVDERDFETFFGVPLQKYYGFELFLARLLGFIKTNSGVHTMTPKGAFYYHYYENFYTLAYIDKMWGLLRKEAFPEQILL